MNKYSLQPFLYGTQEVRTVSIDGEPWFILNDLCAILELSSPHKVAARLDGDDRILVPVTDSLGRKQSTSAVNEGGMYEVIVRSDSPAAKPFRRWVTHTVIPQIRKTGSYGVPPLAGPELMAAALIEAQATLEAHRTRVLELEPRAAAWDVLANSKGDYAVDEAAKILSRDPLIEIGRTRLFSFMADQGWIFRSGSRGRWHAYQTQVDNGRLVQKISAAFLNTRTGEMENPAPTIRITAKGLEELHKRLTNLLEGDAA